MIFSQENTNDLGFCVGAGCSLGAFDIDKIYTAPLGINYVFGKNVFNVEENNIFVSYSPNTGQQYKCLN